MKPTNPFISIVVCCYNASNRISDTIYGLLNQSAANEKYEIIIVDNNSNDYEDLLRVIDCFDKKVCTLKIIQEMKPGLSSARNRGVQESKGEYVFFIDDDAIANTRLVEHCIKCIEEHKPDVIGGNVLPLFAVQPPKELDYSYWVQWSLKHFGESDRWLGEREYFIGTNIGALRELLIANPFNPELGRKGEALIGGEEWYLGDSRFRRRFVAGAYVLHKVPTERMTVDYFVKRSLGYMHQKGLKVRRFQLLTGWLREAKREFKLAVKKVLFQARFKSELWRSKDSI